MNLFILPVLRYDFRFGADMFPGAECRMTGVKARKAAAPLK